MFFVASKLLYYCCCMYICHITRRLIKYITHILYSFSLNNTQYLEKLFQYINELYIYSQKVKINSVFLVDKPVTLSLKFIVMICFKLFTVITKAYYWNPLTTYSVNGIIELIMNWTQSTYMHWGNGIQSCLMIS